MSATTKMQKERRREDRWGCVGNVGGVVTNETS
jgi:hypothetical protein